MADLTNNGSGNLNSAAKKADDVTSKIANPGTIATSAGIGAAGAGMGGAIASKASALPSAADISKLSSQLPGGLGNSVTKAQQLTQEMQNMKCPDFNSGMPGAAKAAALSEHLSTIEQAGNDIQNPLGSKIKGAQDALDKVKANPSAENIKNLQSQSGALKSSTCDLYCSGAAQKAKDFGSNAEASAASAAATAKQNAVAAAQASAKKYTDQANAMSANMLSKVNADEAFKNSAQQTMLSKAQSMPIPLNMNSAAAGAALSQGVCAALSKKYPNSQDTIQHVNNAIQNSTTIVGYIQTAQMAGMGSGAASQMQSGLPQTSSATLPSSPYANANSVIQNLALPNCPQLSSLQRQLGTAQDAISQGLYGNPVASQLQQVQGLQQQYSQLPPSTQQQMGSGNPFDAPVNCMQENIDAQQAAESPAPGLLVVAGAKGVCSFGAQFTVMAPPDGVLVNKMAVAQPLDVIFEPAGVCTSQLNPITFAQTQAATAAALGVFTPVPGPCLLISAAQAIPAAWQPTTGEKYVIEGQPCLIGESCGQCIYGGKLSFIDPGQTDTVAPIGA